MVGVHVRAGFFGAVASAALAIIMLVQVMAPPIEVTAQSSTVLELGAGIDESLEDHDSDGLAEYLVISVEVSVYVPGSYGLHGSVPSTSINANVGPLPLSIGSQELELRFSGADISSLSSPRQLQIMVEAYSRDVTIETTSRTYTTSMVYDPADFELPSGALGTYVYLKGDRVIIEGPVMQVTINQTRPELTFSYSGDAADSTRSSITYTEVVAFDDLDEDGIYDEGSDQERYQADLNLVDWKLETDFTGGYDIALYGVLQLRLVGTATVAAWAKMTFRVDSDSLRMDGTIQKFDIDIDLWQPLDADRLAVRHRLEDVSGGRDIMVGGEGDNMTGDPFVLKVVTEDGDTQGVYSWSNEVSVGPTEPDQIIEARSWFVLDGNGASVWFSYPLDTENLVLHHDPTVGMDPDNYPEMGGNPPFLENRPLLMIGGALIGTAVIMVTVYLRIRSKKAKGPFNEGKPGLKGGD